ncbi:hypothetical protein [Paeniglutamicibacter antarcticus]|uniref:Subtilisin inhibitor-like n=1 Tax=Paeniglutamicibacter antarcticus TaxID=494023 RepID=A0ABP9TGQ8_9MICC
MRASTHSIIPALLLGATMVLTGCAGGGSMEPSASASSDGAPSADLQVSILADGTSESDHYSLQCNGAQALETSVHPNAGEACALVEKEPQVLAQSKPDPTIACTLQSGGPAVARVSGTLHGKAVERSFDLVNGCAIAQWQSASALLDIQPGLQ